VSPGRTFAGVHSPNMATAVRLDRAKPTDDNSLEIRSKLPSRYANYRKSGNLEVHAKQQDSSRSSPFSAYVVPRGTLNYRVRAAELGHRKSIGTASFLDTTRREVLPPVISGRNGRLRSRSMIKTFGRLRLPPRP
jgi:hypothetical protein